LSRTLARRAGESERSRSWIVYRRRGRILTLLVIAVWCSLLTRYADVRELVSQLPIWVLALIPLSGALVWSQFIAYSGDAEFLGQRWTAIDLLRLAVWKAVSLYIPLLMVSGGMEDINRHRLLGLLWLLVGGLTAFQGTLRLRSAEGVKLRPVKSGEQYKRASVLSKRAGVHLRQVCVVPFGRGRLSNAYGGGQRIAVTDDYGHWLHGRQLDFVIGHELAHVKHQHGLKKLGAILGIFGVTGILTFWLPHIGLVGSVVVSFGAVFLPLVCVYFVSRRFEYAADRGAFELTGDAEAGIRSLTDLYAHTRVPVTCTWIEEVFSTHPTLLHRVDAITRAAALR